MPFISQLIAYNPTGGPFTGTVLVEKNLFVSCSNFVTLNAIVLGSLRGHPVEWVQLTGTPVIWTEPQNQLSVTYQQPSVRDDKTFRFYVDRGQDDEVTRDILVTAIPQDTGPLQAPTESPALIPNLGTYTASTGFGGLQIGPTQNPFDQGSITVDSNLVLSWQPATLPPTLGQDGGGYYVIERQSDGSFTEISVGPVTWWASARANTTYYLEYRFRSVAGPNVHTIRIGPMSWVPSPHVEAIGVDDQAWSFQPRSGASSIQITAMDMKSLLQLDPDPDSSLFQHTASTGSSIITVTDHLIRTLEQIAPGSAGPDSDYSVWQHSGIRLSNQMKITAINSIGITTLG